MKKVIKIVLVVKEEEPKQLQQKHHLEMQKSTMSYGMVSWSMGGENKLPRGSRFLVVEVLWMIFRNDLYLAVKPLDMIQKKWMYHKWKIKYLQN